MDTSILIILAVILIILVLLNHLKTSETEEEDLPTTASCSQTSFGCCPNGVDSKINFYGTNCPAYSPGPGYLPTKKVIVVSKPLPHPVHPLPPPPHPIYKPVGGCSGTRYGCCPDNITPKVDEHGSNCVFEEV
jgi:hypothetical protein